MTKRKFGVLAEDETDAEAMRVIIQRRLGSGVSVKKRSDQGCAHLRRKAKAWMDQFAMIGVSDVILLHDLDRNSEPALRSQLEKIPVPEGMQRHICIPVEELEAWLWADPEVVKDVGNGQGKASPSPHRISNPKKALIDLSLKGKRRPLYSTQENPRLAGKLNFKLCADRCPSFKGLLEFLGT